MRDHPECSNMRRAEKKVSGLLGYALPRAFKILFYSGSKEARMMRKRRKEWNKYYKTAKKEKPDTGYAVE